MILRDWSAVRVLVVSVLWAVGVLVFVGWRLLNGFRGASTSGSMIGVSAGVVDLLKIAALILVPPVALFVTWFLQRRSA
jgi:hypothetical protein